MSRATWMSASLALAVICPLVCRAQTAPEPGVDSLLVLLRDGDPPERERAAAALGRSADPRALSALVGALEDRSHLVRREAATALGEIGDPRAMGPLVDVLGDRSVRKWAAAALGRIDAAKAVSGIAARIDGDPAGYGPRAVEALRHLGESGVDALIGLLAREEEALRRSALYALRNALTDESTGASTSARRAPIVEAIIALFARGGGDFLHPSARIQILEVTEDPRAVRLMTRLMVDPGGNLPHELDAALKRRYLQGKAEQPFLDALHDPDERIRAGAIAALGILKSTRALDFLCEAVARDEFEPARRNAARALGQMRHPCAVEPLIAAAGNREEERRVRQAALVSLMRFDDVRIKALFERMKIDPYEDEWIRRSVLSVAEVAVSTGVTESIARRLQSEDPVVSARAAVDLAVLGDLRGARRLREALADRDEQARSIALDGVRHVKAPQIWKALTLSPFLAIVKDRSETLENRRVAAEILLRRDASRAEEPLIEVFKDTAEDEKARGIALEVLARSKKMKLGELLVDFLDRPDTELGAEVVRLLAKETGLDLGKDPRDWRAWIADCMRDENQRRECGFLDQE